MQSILISGGGSGIGSALALELADRGRNVMVTGRRPNLLEAIANRSTNIVAHPADVTREQDQVALVEAFAGLPAPRSLFHGAGYFQLGQLESLTHADWQRSFDTNVTARWALSVKCSPYLERGRVLFVGSDSAKNVRAGGAAYSIAQSASETLRRALQAEWASRDIAVAGFKPGLVDTELVRGFLAMSYEEFPARAAFQGYIERGEYSTPEMIASFAAWLLMDVDSGRFKTTEWDVRDKEHRSEWLDSSPQD